MNLTKISNLGHEPGYALNGASLEVYPGEMVALVGRRGSGKSTFLSILSCRQRPDSGRVLIDDQEVSQLTDWELAQVRLSKVGFFSQDINLQSNETALVNVETALSDQALGDQERRQKAWQAIRLVGIEQRLVEQKLGLLSAGQQVRVGVARALANDPPLLFADEPTKGLDGVSREQVLDLFQKLNDEGRTIVIATPDSSVGNHCRRVVKIADGKIVDDGPVSKRRIITPSRIPGPRPGISVGEEQAVCPRCNYGNPKDETVCQRCNFTFRPPATEEMRPADVAPIHVDGGARSARSAVDGEGVPVQAVMEELKKIPFFARLGSRSLSKLMPSVEQRRYRRGSTIVKEGDAGDSYYVIKSGDVQVVALDQDGREVPIAQLGPREGFGEMALLTDQPRYATVVALTDLVVWRVPKSAFEQILSTDRSLSVYFNDILRQRISDLNERRYPSA